MVPELRKHTQIPVTQAQQGVLGTDSLWVLSLSRPPASCRVPALEIERISRHRVGQQICEQGERRPQCLPRGRRSLPQEESELFARSLAQQLVLLIGGRIERGLRDGARRARPSQGMSGMDGRTLRASAITPDGRHPGRTARQPFWPFCGGRAARRISMRGQWAQRVPPMHAL